MPGKFTCAVKPIPLIIQPNCHWHRVFNLIYKLRKKYICMTLRNKFFSAAIVGGALLMNLNVSAQQAGQPGEPPTELPKNWHTLDLKVDGYAGISLMQAYQFVAGKKSKTVLVATID